MSRIISLLQSYKLKNQYAIKWQRAEKGSHGLNNLLAFLLNGMTMTYIANTLVLYFLVSIILIKNWLVIDKLCLTKLYHVLYEV
jgi:hypothetical protein